MPSDPALRPPQPQPARPLFNEPKRCNCCNVKSNATSPAATPTATILNTDSGEPASPEPPRANVSRMWLWPFITFENRLKSSGKPSNVRENCQMRRRSEPNAVFPDSMASPSITTFSANPTVQPTSSSYQPLGLSQRLVECGRKSRA